MKDGLDGVRAAILADTKDLARLMQLFGPKVTRCPSGRFYVIGQACPHCKSEVPRVRCLDPPKVPPQPEPGGRVFKGPETVWQAPLAPGETADFRVNIEKRMRPGDRVKRAEWTLPADLDTWGIRVVGYAEGVDVAAIKLNMREDAALSGGREMLPQTAPFLAKVETEKGDIFHFAVRLRIGDGSRRL